MLRPATWQLTRTRKVNPVGTGQPTFPRYVVGTWAGSWSPATAVIRELAAGAPIVDIDMYGFLPADAGAVIFEGDVLLWMEKATRWEVARVGAFPSRTVVMLRRATEKKVTGG